MPLGDGAKIAGYLSGDREFAERSVSMDSVDGTDCGRLLQERYPDGLPASETLAILRSVADALDSAHARGLFHCDITPANILLTDTDDDGLRILLSDFGAPPSAGDDSEAQARLGAVTYAAPEQLTSRDVDGRTDQYALAVTAYHLLTGAPPFRHEQPAVVIGLHLNAKPPRLADSRPELAAFDAALARALSKDPEQRFATCAEFVLALEQAADEVSPGGD
ncbi:serine/threonine-protein kinase [Mycolicibacterium arseniciresistens]|uniref:non-specific serine/threonine protein kinase n=1 Tax=Mycolicibacterium arseniciresistens TaxID=3062257 RepID=A0ABT8U9M9_9MYCO|nr:serine/threonine-protein kinase [Mycolicibacterium arseniciresistens]MDO3634487.1 serine/threonine-protein kinase [Mycolicibacterium arseniciresistens]